MATELPLGKFITSAESLPAQAQSTPFRPRGQFIGTLNWLCPACGKINRENLTPTAGWKIRCKARLCGAVFAVGWTFWQLPQGAAQIPPLDIGLPACDPFPPCEVGTLRTARFIYEAIPLDEAG